VGGGRLGVTGRMGRMADWSTAGCQCCFRSRERKTAVNQFS